MNDPLTLRTAIGNYGHTKALKDGLVGSERVRLEQVEVEPITDAFRRMARRLEFDVSEMALTTHALSHAYDKPYTAIPVVLLRDFHHGAIVYNTKSGLRGPADLAGRRVGVRAYTQTTGVWVRGILKTEYGVDLDSLTWVTFEDAHVQEYEDPPNVVRAAPGKTIGGMLLAGEIDAAVGLRQAEAPEIQPLIPNAEQAADAWYRKTGVYPVNHVVVVKDELLAAHPWLGPELLGLFTAAKQRYLQQLRAASPSAPEYADRRRQMALVGDDPLPYGLKANREGIEMLLEFAADQKLTPRVYRVEELFVASTD